MEASVWCPRLSAAMMLAWICGPGEGFGIKVGLGDEAVDGSLEINNASKDTAL
jgi:hypothetical protein